MNAALRLSISLKLGWSFALIVAVIAITSAISFFSVSYIQTSGAWTEHTYIVMGAVNRMVDGIDQASDAILRYSISPDPAQIKGYRHGQDLYRKALLEIRLLTSDNASVQSQLNALESVYSVSNVAPVDAVELGDVASQQLEFAASISSKLADQAFLERVHSLAAGIMQAEELLLQTRRKSETTAYYITFVALTTGISASIMAAIWAWLVLSRSITRPIVQISHAMTNWGQRDPALLTQFVESRGDEIGQMAGAILRFQANLAQAELARASEQRRVAILSEELREHNRDVRMRAIVNTVPDGILTIDVDGRVESLNPAACTLFSLSADTGPGENILDLLSFPGLPADHTFQNVVSAFLMGPGSTPTISVIAAGKTGPFPVDFSMSAMEVDGKQMYTAVIRDITERTRVDRELLQSLVHLKSLNELDSAILTAQSSEVIGERALAVLKSLVGHSIGRIQLFDNKVDQVSDLYADCPDGLSTGTSSLSAAPFSVDEVQALSKGDTITRNLSGVTFAILPMQADGRLFGAVNLEFPPGEIVSAAKYVTAISIVDRLAVALHQSILRQTILEQSQEMKRSAAAYTVQLESDNEELKAFSYSVSHDLRAPLRAIDGFARILSEEHLSDFSAEGQRQLAIIRTNSRRMGQLIDDLLAFSRLSRQSINRASFRTDILVDEILRDLVRDWPKPAKITISELPASFGDRALLRQVWMNLLSNAFKYSSTREIPEIWIDATDGGDKWQFNIRDNGVGFDMRYYAKLFGVFQRLHTNAEYPGTGVGLAIVERIVVRHGGSVWGESVLENGAQFHFTLPKEPKNV